jgi:hypothetical protein
MSFNFVNGERMFLIVVSLLIAHSSHGLPSTINSSTESDVRATVQSYLDGIRSGVIADLKRPYAKDATYQGFYDGFSYQGPIQELIDETVGFPSPNVMGNITELKIDSRYTDTAFVTLDEQNAIVNEAESGQAPSLATRHFTDLFIIKKHSGNWKIVSKVFSTFPKGQ